VIEERSVNFDAAELLRAVEIASRVAEALGLRPGEASSVEFQPAEQLVKFSSPERPHLGRSITAEALAALLVAYCTRIGVPLPRKGQKHLDIGANGVTLRIAVEQDARASTAILQHEYPGAMVWPRRRNLRG
jgi:hypothetical protein